MDYSKLVAVTGLPGLFELINSKTDGAIVRSLEDKSTRFISNRKQHFSQLESIEVFTVNDNVNLAEIFFAMEKSGADLPDVKDDSVVKKYFEKIYPDMDFERVYSSDLKKMVKWFDVLKKKNIEIKLPELPEEPEVEKIMEEPVKKEKPAPKSAKKTDHAKAVKASAGKEVGKETAKTAPVRRSKGAGSESGKKPAVKATGTKRSEESKSAGTGKGANSKKGRK